MAMRPIFRGCCINRFGIGPFTLHFEPFRFWLRIRGDIRNRKTTRRVGESLTLRLGSGSRRQFNYRSSGPATLVVTFTCELFGCFDEIMFSPIANVFLAILFTGPKVAILSR